ncbi:hypothetical protein [Corticicoccus populi]|uniref:Uncharacterized protein n=1 Tax=Corticicoccus populi TaxID=1812821 RepID=A0ABW5WUN4_9STAP
MESYKQAKEQLLSQKDYRSFIYRATRLPEMMDKELAYFKEIQENFKEEGFNHLSAVELCRTFVRVDILKLSLMQSTHGIYTDGSLHYAEEQETLEKFTLENSKLDFYQLQLPEDLEKINGEVREKVIEFNKGIEPFLRLIEENVGQINETLKVVITELMNSNPHILSKIYDETFYDVVLDYNINNAFEASWKKQTLKTPLVSFYSVFTLSYYDDMFKEQLM